MSFRKAFKTKDSALAFYVNQLDNLDKRLYMPLTSVSWGRDIKLRSGITMDDESTSFIQSAFGAPGTLAANANASGGAGGNIPWISPETTAIPGISIDGTRTVNPLRLAAREISFTSVELARSQRLGQPLDTQKTNALNLLYQMNIDQMVYIGATEVGATGLLNNAGVTAGSVATGVSGLTFWANKTPDEILSDVNTALESTYADSAFAFAPSKLGLPPVQFGYLASQKVSSAGNVSILKFLKENSIALELNGKELEIVPMKWATGRGAGGLDRMIVYTNEEDRVRYPMVPVRRETAYYQGIRFSAPYIWALGVMEIPYPETIQYWDGI